MGGFAHNKPHLAASRALLAGVALFATTMAAEARSHRSGETALHRSGETAMAVPRLAAPGSVGVALPHPLDAVDGARIRRVFAAQRKGDLTTANRETEQLDVFTPLGHAMLGQILADRYLGRFYRPSAAELSGWLIAWADQPDARAIYELLLRRLPKGAAAPPPPPVPKGELRPKALVLAEGPDPAVNAQARNLAFERSVRDRIEAGQTDAALKLIARARGLSGAEIAQLRGEVAQALFTANNDDAALDLAKSTLQDSGGAAGLAAYVAGLAAWRLGHEDEALPYFEAAAIASQAPPALRAAGSFWAGRANLRLGNVETAKFWMLRATEEPNTFYGLIARHALGGRTPTAKPVALRKPHGLLGEADIDAVSATAEGTVAFALLQVGEADRAGALLRRLDARMHDNAGIHRAIGLIADKVGLRDPLAQPAGRTGAASLSATLISAIPNLAPLDGFRVDPALILALTRVESNFDPAAVSSAGARGLMQLMPETATSMATDTELETSSLDDPGMNLELGQRYVLYLARRRSIANDLIRLLASYNAGPGKCAGWDIRDGGDPLLYIESIPIEQTRVFVQRALAFNWLYAAKLNQPAPSLDELASGGFPHLHEVSAATEATPSAAPAVPAKRRHRHT